VDSLQDIREQWAQKKAGLLQLSSHLEIKDVFKFRVSGNNKKIDKGNKQSIQDYMDDEDLVYLMIKSGLLRVLGRKYSRRNNYSKSRIRYFRR